MNDDDNFDQGTSMDTLKNTPMNFYSFDSRNEEWTRLLELCDAHGLLVCKTNFCKPASHMITCHGWSTPVRLTTFSLDT